MTIYYRKLNIVIWFTFLLLCKCCCNAVHVTLIYGHANKAHCWCCRCCCCCCWPLKFQWGSEFELKIDRYVKTPWQEYAGVVASSQLWAFGIEYFIAVHGWFLLIGHFRISLDLFPKARLGAQPFMWKKDFIHLQIKLIFIWMVVHHASLWWRGLGELGNELLKKILNKIKK